MSNVIIMFRCLYLYVAAAFLYQPQHVCIVSELGERLSLVTVFALSVRYECPDLSLAVSGGLLEVLVRLCAPTDGLHQPALCGMGHFDNYDPACFQVTSDNKALCRLTTYINILPYLYTYFETRQCQLFVTDSCCL